MKTLENKILKIIKNNNATASDGFRIDITGQDMLDMGWDIADDSPDDEYELVIHVEDKEINCSILCSNNEYTDSGFSFDYEDTLIDLDKNGYIK